MYVDSDFQMDYVISRNLYTCIHNHIQVGELYSSYLADAFDYSRQYIYINSFFYSSILLPDSSCMHGVKMADFMCDRRYVQLPNVDENRPFTSIHIWMFLYTQYKNIQF